MSDFSIALAVLGFLLSIVSAFIAARCVSRLRGSLVLLKTFEPSRMASCEKRLLEVQQALDELATSVRMSKVRRAALVRDNGSGLPDPYKDPDAWRTAVQAKLGATKHGL